MMATAFASSSPQFATFLSTSSPSSTLHFHTLFNPLPTTSSFPPIIITTSKKSIHFQTNLKPVAAAAASPIQDAAIVDAADQFVSTTDDGVSVIVSALFFVAFIGLSVITLGVIYLAVTDFLTKREKDKFEKEEAAKSGKKKKNKKVVRAGPRGFGQKIVETKDVD